MSNTSNRWKSQGGINRRAMNNILSNNKQATNTLTIPQQLGISNTAIEQYGNVYDMSNTFLNNTQIGGTLNVTGDMNVNSNAIFYETVYFNKGIVDSCNTIIYDNSAVSHIDIFTTSNYTSQKASIFIQNALGDTNSDHRIPSMLVYNQEPISNGLVNTASMENLIFSISGENVSIGEIYGQNTFDVGGNSSFLGKVSIGKSETSMVTSNSATLDVNGSVIISGETSIQGPLDVSDNITSNGSIILDQPSSSINIGESGNQIHIGNNGSASYFDSFVQPIHFRTVNDTNTRFAIVQSGNVGIGNNNINPQYTLDVSGTMYVSSSLDVNGVGRFQDVVYGKTPHNDASGQEFPTCEWVTTNYAAEGGWKNEIDGNGIYNFNIGYNVGIGTKTPEYTLDVCGDIHLTGDLMIEGSNLDLSGSITAGGSITTDSNITVGQDITVDGMAKIGDKIGIGLGTIAIDPSFVLDISGHVYSNGNILSRGKIGIGDRGTENNSGVQLGKNEPEFTLDVGGTMRVSDTVTFLGPVFGPAPSLPITDPSGGLQLVTMKWVTDAIGTNGGWVRNDNFLYNGNIDTVEGYVGIGTTTPSATLDVSGNMFLRGTSTFTGTITAPNSNTFGTANLGNTGANTQRILGDLIVDGDFTVNGSTTTISTTNLDVSTNLISLNNGFSGTPVHDSGILIYRGDASNVFMGWGETSDKFLFGTTAATSSDTGDLNINPVDIEVHNLNANGDITLSGSLGIAVPTDATILENDKLTVYGNIKCYNSDHTAKIESDTFNATSDMRLKENIHDLSNSLEKICAIRGVEYNWKADETKKLHSGVIAQEVKESIPEAVNTDNKEQYSVDYNAIIGHLIEAVKTLKQEVDDLKGQLKK
jgi:hypothetical protein